MVVDDIRKSIESALKNLDIDPVDFTVEHPADMSHGDYATNVALVAARLAEGSPRRREKLSANSRELADNIVAVLRKVQDDLNLEKIEVAGPGFINFHLSREFFANVLTDVITSVSTFGRNERLAGQKVGVEFYQPNYFKALHIGHLVNAVVGESLCRLLEFSGANAYRIGYYADIGPHIAKAVWGLADLGITPKKPTDLSKAYEHGVARYKEDERVREDIDALNQALYRGDDKKAAKLYKKGAEISFQQAEALRTRLGFSFDHLFFESEAGTVGTALVQEHVGDVFEESDGALIFRGEQYGLHTRVFLTAKGLPVYETKDVGLAKLKTDRFSVDQLLYVVDHEQTEYFKVVLEAIELLFPELAGKTKHVPHGRLGLKTGRMSSREGNIIMADAFLNELRDRAQERIDDAKIADQIGMAAMQYFVLKQALGTNITFEEEKALSLEGDSGPYLQYTYVRTSSVLKKAQSEGVKSATDNPRPEVTDVERLLYKFPEVVERATREYAPHFVTQYLTELAGAFNSFYAQEQIVDTGDEYSPYKLALTEAVGVVLKNGLWLLGITAPERM